MIPTYQLGGAGGRRRAAAAGDPYWANVVLAMHMDGANGSTTFTDEKGHATSAIGSTQITTANSKFGGAACNMPAGSVIDLGASSDYQFGTGDFTFEWWSRPTKSTGFGTGFMIDFGINLSNGFSVSLENSSGLELRTSTGNKIGVNIPGSTGSFAFYTISRVGNTCYVGKNGVVSAYAFAVGNHTYNGNCYLGYGSSTYGYGGDIDDFRVTKGVARYTSSFTPPAAAFPNG